MNDEMKEAWDYIESMKEKLQTQANFQRAQIISGWGQVAREETEEEYQKRLLENADEYIVYMESKENDFLNQARKVREQINKFIELKEKQ